MTHGGLVLLVGGSDADVARLDAVLRACGRAAEVQRLRPDDATRALASRPDLLCVLVALEDGCGTAADWRRRLSDAGVDAPLLVLGEVSQEPLISRWLSEGAHDWLFRPHLSGLCAALSRLERERREAADRARVERALLESERRFKDLFEHASDAIALYRVEPGGRIVLEDLNGAAEAVSGLARAQAAGHTLAELLDRAAAEELELRLSEVIATRRPAVGEHELPLPAGARWLNTATLPLLDEAGQVRRIATISRDVTQARAAEALRRGLEAQLAESQKSEALARLASHIAHDVNNLLAVVVAHAQRLQGTPGKPAEVAQGILQATGRGRELTQQVLTLGRRRPPERKPLELTSLVREALKRLEPTAHGVTLRESTGRRVPRVMGDAGQLHQVLTSLCTNGLRAMPHGQGTLTVALAASQSEPPFASRPPPLEGPWVRLTVSDTGVGMDEATTKRIFEPFLSSRPDGSGTGLGLAVVRSIVQGHDGVVEVESAPGRGSAFHVYLPALQDDASQPGGGQHLMLVDDHPGMARVSARLLETLGYRTTVFEDPRQALQAFTAGPAGFDAVLTDLSMPQMSGEDFMSALRALRPEVPIIVSSGMASELDAPTRQRLGISAVLVKPWRVEEAVAALQRALV